VMKYDSLSFGWDILIFDARQIREQERLCEKQEKNITASAAQYT